MASVCDARRWGRVMYGRRRVTTIRMVCTHAIPTCGGVPQRHPRARYRAGGGGMGGCAQSALERGRPWREATMEGKIGKGSGLLSFHLLIAGLPNRVFLQKGGGRTYTSLSLSLFWALGFGLWVLDMHPHALCGGRSAIVYTVPTALQPPPSLTPQTRNT